MSETILEVVNLKKYFPVTRGVVFKKTVAHVHAVDDISFRLNKGQTLALVGETGSGKTTTAKLIVRLLESTSGRIIIDSTDVTRLRGQALRKVHRQIAMVFQDPFASLDPRRSIDHIIREPLRAHRWGNAVEQRRRVRQLLEQVGLNPEDARKFPHQFSGGQRQRISIARALALSPKLLVADEPVSALDASVQAKIINLLSRFQHDLGLSYLLIAHDLGIVRHISQYVAVMYLGKIVEAAATEELFRNPLHPYTRALMASIPIPNPQLMRVKPPQLLAGEIPSPVAPPLGCRFHTRCSYAQGLCSQTEPELVYARTEHIVHCHFWQQIEGYSPTSPTAPIL